MQTSLIVIGILAFVILCISIAIIVTFNGIVENANRIRRAWSDVLVQERQKTRILDSLQEHFKQYKEYESSLMQSVTKLRAQISGLSEEPSHSSLGAVQQETRTLLSGLRVAVEAYPDLHASSILSGLMREITEQEENVGAAIRIYNAAVEHFNNSIQTFFGSWVNDRFNKKPEADSFTDSVSAGSFEFKPNLP